VSSSTARAVATLEEALAAWRQQQHTAAGHDPESHEPDGPVGGDGDRRDG
jgi:hypothetical protein